MTARKKTTEHPDASPLQWLFERGGQALGQAVREFAAQPGVSEGVANLAREAVKTKGRVDKNVEQLLHALNLPSRADYDKLLRKMEHLQGSLVNLNIKLDRALAAQKAAAEPTPKAAPEAEKKA
jgi:hypothetical protein